MEVEQQKAILTLENPIKAPKHEHVYVFTQRVPIGALCKIVCPECGCNVVKKISKVGKHRWDCPQCKAIIGFVAEKSEQPKKQKKQDKSNQDIPKQDSVGSKEEGASKPHTKKIGNENLCNLGELTWGGFFSRKHYPLRVGTIYIGRKDDGEPSDLQLEDSYISRRSALLEVLSSDKGFLFKLTVKHASNPVYVNSSEISVGNSIYLNYGDVLIFGKTKMTFKKKV